MDKRRIKNMETAGRNLAVFCRGINFDVFAGVFKDMVNSGFEVSIRRCAVAIFTCRFLFTSHKFFQNFTLISR